MGLQEQRERGAFTADERDQLREAAKALKNAVVQRTDTRVEDRGVSADVRALMAGIDCTR